ncbi:MAG TPA: PH domain-containing protein, partial [Chloroflexota bacterium]|nr:PH domain-containing protein [Chloroflexota bacterium]
MSKLLPGENLVVKDHPHWVTIVGTLILPAVLVVAVAIADFTILSPNNVNSVYVPHLRTFLSLGVVALALLWLIAVWISWRSITYTLTDQRIMIQKGVFSRQEKIIPIDRVQ